MARVRTRRAITEEAGQRVGEAEDREAAPLMLENPEGLIREQNRIARRIAGLNQRLIEVQRLQGMALVLSPTMRRPKRVRVADTPLLGSTPLHVLQASPALPLPLRTNAAYEVELPPSNLISRNEINDEHIPMSTSKSTSMRAPQVRSNVSVRDLPSTSRQIKDDDDDDDEDDDDDDDDEDDDDDDDHDDDDDEDDYDDDDDESGDSQSDESDSEGYRQWNTGNFRRNQNRMNRRNGTHDLGQALKDSQPIPMPPPFSGLTGVEVIIFHEKFVQWYHHNRHLLEGNVDRQFAQILVAAGARPAALQFLVTHKEELCVLCPRVRKLLEGVQKNGSSEYTLLGTKRVGGDSRLSLSKLDKMWTEKDEKVQFAATRFQPISKAEARKIYKGNCRDLCLAFAQVARVRLARVTKEDLPSWYSSLVMGVPSPMDPLVPPSENPSQFIRRVMHAHDIVSSFGEAVRLDLPKHHPLEVFLMGIPKKAGEKATEALGRMPSLVGNILEEMSVAAKAATKYLEHDGNLELKSLLGINHKASQEGVKNSEKISFRKKFSLIQGHCLLNSTTPKRRIPFIGRR